MFSQIDLVSDKRDDDVGIRLLLELLDPVLGLFERVMASDVVYDDGRCKK